MRKPPCKDCLKRHFNCHSMCSEYKGWKKERDEMMAKKDDAGLTINEANKRKYWKNLRRNSMKKYV